MARHSRALSRSSATYQTRDPGGRALLFERLTDKEFHSQQEKRPFRYHDLEGLELSIFTELDRLLNTRRGPFNPQMGSKGTVIDFGIPDNILDNPSGVPDQEKLCGELKTAIQTFEPRLRSVDIVVYASDNKYQTVTVEISGEVELDTEKLAVRFPVIIGGETDLSSV